MDASGSTPQFPKGRENGRRQRDVFVAHDQNINNNNNNIYNEKNSSKGRVCFNIRTVCVPKRLDIYLFSF